MKNIFINIALNLKMYSYRLKASLIYSSDDFWFKLGFAIRFDLNPHFLVISRSIETFSITLVGLE